MVLNQRILSIFNIFHMWNQTEFCWETQKINNTFFYNDNNWTLIIQFKFTSDRKSIHHFWISLFFTTYIFFVWVNVNTLTCFLITFEIQMNWINVWEVCVRTWIYSPISTISCVNKWKCSSKKSNSNKKNVRARDVKKKKIANHSNRSYFVAWEREAIPSLNIQVTM